MFLLIGTEDSLSNELIDGYIGTDVFRSMLSYNRNGITVSAGADHWKVLDEVGLYNGRDAARIRDPSGGVALWVDLKTLVNSYDDDCEAVAP
jgi:hypothetical protein